MAQKENSYSKWEECGHKKEGRDQSKTESLLALPFIRQKLNPITSCPASGVVL
jgi:hypothetical protein